MSDEGSSLSSSSNSESSACSSSREQGEYPADDISEKVSQSVDASVLLNVNNIDKLDEASTLKVSNKVKEVKLCLLCLEDRDEADDELIECDGCGIVVHEDCHKISGSIFLSSGTSSCSTDPWFCEVCLACLCELCPNRGGVYKRTDNARWVHLLCALYTPGVAFNDPENLMEVRL
ncbi:unnamed protein product [Protopolystoma xenopodis]|uniref:Uncharacterized protein n=1 Tax=Protopolystoma xenopodis TaxID=117903 RepID=A0A448XAK4_9PLAT|nr:unnamed protein product [Protopolystoma xenopodis]